MATHVVASDPSTQEFSSVGRPIPHQTLRIAAREDPHHTLRIGERGEILVAGMIMMEYWEDPVKTAAALCVTTSQDGSKIRWVRTGDEGEMDADGYLKVTGRIKDIIIRGGENIYSVEVEDMMVQCSGVRSASVVGLPDKAYGEVVAAFVVPEPAALVVAVGEDNRNSTDLRIQLATADQDKHLTGVTLSAAGLREQIQAKLSRHLVPKYIFWVDELPLTPTEKVEKHKLRDRGNAAIVKRDERTVSGGASSLAPFAMSTVTIAPAEINPLFQPELLIESMTQNQVKPEKDEPGARRPEARLKRSRPEDDEPTRKAKALRGMSVVSA